MMKRGSRRLFSSSRLCHRYVSGVIGVGVGVGIG